MIEVYAFLAMFAIQVMAVSVLFPARIIRYAFAQAQNISAERLAQVYPGVDHDLATKRFLTQLRVGSATLAVLGLSLLGWLFSYMRRPDWELATVGPLLATYSLLQYLPLLLSAWLGYRLYKMHEHSLPEGKRKAMLERRNLFHFISPIILCVAVLAYFLVVALVVLAEPMPSSGAFLIGILTLVYAVQAFDAYRALYGKKRSPFDTDALRLQRIGFAVTIGVYVCILNAVFFAAILAIDLLDLKKWIPFAISVLFVAISLLMSTRLTVMARRPAAGNVPSARVPGGDAA